MELESKTNSEGRETSAEERHIPDHNTKYTSQEVLGSSLKTHLRLAFQIYELILLPPIHTPHPSSALEGSQGLSHPSIFLVFSRQRDLLLWKNKSNSLVTDCPWGESHHGDGVQLAFARIHTTVNALSNNISA